MFERTINTKVIFADGKRLFHIRSEYFYQLTRFVNIVKNTIKIFTEIGLQTSKKYYTDHIFC